MVSRSAGLSAVLAAGLVLGGLALPAAASAAEVNVAYGWGDNYFGQAGAPFEPPLRQATVADPAPLPGLASDVVQVSAGAAHGLALHADGTVWAWGYNRMGELGDGTTNDRYIPQPVLGLPPGIVQVSAGDFHSLAVAQDGSVWAWGQNPYGELGTGGGGYSPRAVQVPGVSDVSKVAAGGAFSVALTRNGEVWTWGRGTEGQLGDGSHVDSRPTPKRVSILSAGVVEIAAGAFHVLARRPGSLWAWGSNQFGQLGNGKPVADSPTPVRVDRRTDNVTMIAAGAYHSLARDANGIWAWGRNDSGQLGLGPGVVDDRNIPAHVDLRVTTPDVTVKQISAGGVNSLAVLSDGDLWVWGGDRLGVVADGSTPIVPVPTRAALSGVVQASVGSELALAIAHADVVSVPNVVGELRVLAVPTLQALGLTANIVMTADRPICDNVGYVVAQTPPAGTLLTQGATVTIWVAQPPPGGCF